ncbi:acyl-CoA dehydrogenase family protein [Brevibacterium casei]|uniref:acyl-CoA dehydrogenase family protein n=1 Tax=Brevibacterium casei TaxID=33889 RepID=UPI0036F757C8
MHTPLVRALTELTKPWYRPGTDSPHEDEFLKLVTSTAPLATRLAALQGFWNLTGTSSALKQWDALTAIASADVAVARMLEPHIDALGILAEAGHPTPGPESSWGVFAAEIPGRVVTATPAADGTLVLYGEKAWCSLATELTHAIVSVRLGEARQTVAVDLTGPGVRPAEADWPALGLAEIPSGPIVFDGARATEVGPPEWYLQRPGFAWGGIRVAACWFGGALGLARNAAQRHFGRPQPSPLGAMTLGQIDTEITAARTVLAHAAQLAGSGDIDSHDDSWTQALRVRTIVYRACQRIQELSRELAGPAALTGDREFAKADADLTVYLSQHHGPRDEASLGEAIVADATPR